MTSHITFFNAKYENKILINRMYTIVIYSDNTYEIVLSTQKIHRFLLFRMY